jgi:hypothetical protein
MSDTLRLRQSAARLKMVNIAAGVLLVIGAVCFIQDYFPHPDENCGNRAVPVSAEDTFPEQQYQGSLVGFFPLGLTCVFATPEGGRV